MSKNHKCKYCGEEMEINWLGDEHWYVCPHCYSESPKPYSPAMERFPEGKWEWNDDNGYYYCSECGAASPREDQDGEYIDCPHFCPNCGADMREEGEHGES